MANPMTHEPCGFHTNPKGALKLAGADAILRRVHEIHGLKPESQRGVACFENGSNFDSEGLAAFVALTKADTGGIAI